MGPGSEAIRRDMPRNRRWRGGKLERDAALREVVLGYLQCGWSPAQVAGRLAQAAVRRMRMNHYRFIYGQLAHYLPQGNETGWRAQGRSPAAFIAPAPSPAERHRRRRPPTPRSLGG